MYTGAGAAPMMAAAAAFSSLADELNTTASASQSAISNLTGEEWIGPSSSAMATAVQPYLTWMHTTAAQLQQAASQAMASAAAYEAAFAMTVPPPLIAANRAQLAALTATNVLGQNTAAIAATEAQYGEMWAQDAAAMYGYAAASAAAGKLSPLTSPAPTNNPGGLGAQAMAVSQATAAGAQTAGLNQVVTKAPEAVRTLAAPAATPGLSGLDSFLGNPVVNNVGNAGFDLVSWNVFNTIVSNILYNHTLDAAASASLAGDVGGAVGGAALVGAAALRAPLPSAPRRCWRAWARRPRSAVCRHRSPGPRRRPHLLPRRPRVRAGPLRSKSRTRPGPPGCPRSPRPGAAAATGWVRGTG